MNLRLGHLCLGTPRLEAMMGFYRAHLGCRIVHELTNDAGERRGVFLEVGGGTYLELLREEPGRGAAGRFRHFAFEVTDIESWAARFRALGQDTQVTRGRTDGAQACWITDPDGNRLELHEHDPESVPYRAAG